MAEKKSVFATLSSISVRDKVEKKGRLDYLSWAHAWSMLKKVYPSSTFHVHTHEGNNGLHYYTDGQTAYVEVSVVVEGEEIVELLAVMDHSNKSIPLERLTSRDVMDTIKRCKTKCIALHGLGLSLWTGDDVPVTPPVSIKPKNLIALAIDDKYWDGVVKYVSDPEHKKKGVEALIKNLQIKYNISTKVKTQLSQIIKAK